MKHKAEIVASTLGGLAGFVGGEAALTSHIQSALERTVTDVGENYVATAQITTPYIFPNTLNFLLDRLVNSNSWVQNAVYGKEIAYPLGFMKVLSCGGKPDYSAIPAECLRGEANVLAKLQELAPYVLTQREHLAWILPAVAAGILGGLGFVKYVLPRLKKPSKQTPMSMDEFRKNLKEIEKEEDKKFYCVRWHVGRSSKRRGNS